MAAQGNFEWLAEGGFVGALSAIPAITALANVGRWRPYSPTDFQSKGYLFVHCPGCTRREDVGNVIVGDPCVIVIGAITSTTPDPTGATCGELIGLVTDFISGSSVPALLNAAQSRLYVFPRGVTPAGQSTHETTSTHHQRAITVHVRATATA